MFKLKDPSTYDRFFAFGCSFTKYYWPTWADIIGKDSAKYYNYGKSGAGNVFIFQSLVEAIVEHRINKNDLVMVMFSNITREDRFTLDRGWITPGNLYYQNDYNEEFLKKFMCHHGYLMRDLSLVHSCKMMLDHLGVDYSLMSIVPFDSKQSDGQRVSDLKYILDFYGDTLNCLEPNVLDTVFKGDWNSRQPRPTYQVQWQPNKYVDNHPTPLEHLEYLNTIFPDINLSDSALEFANQSNNTVLSELFKIDYFKNPGAVKRLGIK
jgi:hypothetical protein